MILHTGWLILTSYNPNSRYLIYKILGAQSQGDIVETLKMLKYSDVLQKRVFQNMYDYFNSKDYMELNLLSMGMPTSSVSILTDYIFEVYGEEDRKKAAAERKRQEAIRVEKERQRKKRQEEVLKDRTTIVYNYNELSEVGYNNYWDLLRDALTEELKKLKEGNFEFSLQIDAVVDSTGRTQTSLRFLPEPERQVREAITTAVTAIKLQSVTKEDIPVNASIKVELPVRYFSGQVKFSIENWDRYNFRNYTPTPKEREVIQESIKEIKNGVYNVGLVSGTIDGKDFITVRDVRFRRTVKHKIVVGLIIAGAGYWLVSSYF